jgi:hypothetical protein
LVSQCTAPSVPEARKSEGGGCRTTGVAEGGTTSAAEEAEKRGAVGAVEWDGARDGVFELGEENEGWMTRRESFLL